jgi:hypothetical protein
MTLKTIVKNIEMQRESLSTTEYILEKLTYEMYRYEEALKSEPTETIHDHLQKTRKQFVEGMKWQGIYQEQLDMLLLKKEAFLNQSK